MKKEVLNLIRFLGKKSSPPRNLSERKDSLNKPSQPVPKPEQEAIEQSHQQALEQGASQYRDPKTGYWVWTETYLKQRGYCCNSGCRHCPYKSSQ